MLLKHKAKAAQEWLKTKVNILQEPNESENLNPIKNLLHCLDIAVNKQHSTNPKSTGANKWVKISPNNLPFTKH